MNFTRATDGPFSTVLTRRRSPREFERSPTVAMIELPAFDSLSGGPEPTDAFGIVLNGQDAAIALARLRSVVEHARRNVREIFGVDIASDSKGAAKLDRVVEDMWSTGWNPHVGDLNLFATHFGALLYDAMDCLGIKQIFRSREVADHHSLWDAETCTEFFPFHKTAKCLLNRQGESMLQMYDAAATLR